MTVEGVQNTLQTDHKALHEKSILKENNENYSTVPIPIVKANVFFPNILIIQKFSRIYFLNINETFLLMSLYGNL